MNLNKIFGFIDKIIYDPVQGRILYDALLTLTSTASILIIFRVFKFPITNYFTPILYPFIFISANLILGLYGKYKTSIFLRKLTIVLISNLIAYLSLMVLVNDYLALTLFFFFSSLATILPRFFLNFNVERITFNPSRETKSNPILVVGGGGYIGSVLVEKLLRKGERVRVLDKFIYSKDVFKGIRNLKNLEIMEGDISDIYALTLAVKDSKAIVHLAGIVGDPAAKLDQKLTRHVNIASTRLLKETARAFGVRKFIFASSCSVYGATNNIQDEGSRAKPISLYAKSKIDSEIELLSDRADGFDPVVLRFATVFGHSRKPRFDLVANLFVAEAFSNKKITVNGGAQWRPFIHVRDLADAIILVLDAPFEKVSRQIFNIGDDDMNITIEDLALKIKNVIGNSELKINIKNKERDKRDYRVSFQKIKKDLGFKSTISFEKGLREIYNNLVNKKYKGSYKDPFYINYEKTKELKKEFRSKKYKKSHFSTIS